MCFVNTYFWPVIFSELKFKLAGRYFRPETEVPELTVGPEEVKNITVVLDSRDADLCNKFLELGAINGLSETDFSIITCEKSRNEGSEGLNFSISDVSWTGKIRKQQLREFFGRRHNIIISFSRNNGRDLEFLIRNSKADLKIGRVENAAGIYDLEIFSRYEEADVFIQEVEKYLRILKYKF